jgi:hypothetical protein
MDEIDKRRASQFAWRVPTLEDLELADPPDVEALEAAFFDEGTLASAQDGDTDDLHEFAETETELDRDDLSADDLVEVLSREESPEEFQARAHRDCRVLARHVHVLWSLTSESAQAAQMPALMDRVEEVGLGLGALEPSAAVRLCRLLVRHWGRLDTAHRKPAFFVSGASFADLDLPVLLAEIAATGNRQMAYALDMALEGEDLALTGLAAQLGRVIEYPVRPEAALIALGWLRWCDPDEARRWLRCALRLPHLLRRQAALTSAMSCPRRLLRGEDVLWLLEDAVEHPLPYDHGHESDEASYAYETALLEAVAILKPEGGHEPLLRILAGDCSYYRRDRTRMDAGWALEALAAGYPEVARPQVDRWLTSPRWRDQVAAVRAAARLPHSEAQQRLLLAATNGGSEVHREVQSEWTRLFRTKCPAPLTAGLDLSRISRPLSARMSSRLAIVRGIVQTPTLPELAKQLLSEAPNQEALALLVLALDSVELIHGGQALPKDRTAWVKELLKRFGPRAADVLLARGAREGVRWYESWAYALAAAHREGLLDKTAVTALGRLLAEAALAGRFERRADPLGALVHVGAPREMLGWCYAELLGGAGSPGLGDDLEALWLQQILAQVEPDARMRSRLRTRLEEACRQPDSEASARALRSLPALAAAWKDLPSLDRLERALDELGSSVHVPSWALAICRALAEQGRVGEAWRCARLARPGETVFAVAAEFVTQAHAAERELLLQALHSDARSGATAAEALVPLLRHTPEAVSPAQIEAIAQAAPPAQRVLLADLLVRLEPRPSWLHPWLVQLASLPDPELHPEICEVLWLHKPKEGIPSVLREAMDLQPDGALADRLARILRTPTRADCYWMTPSEDEQEDDQESFAEEEMESELEN